MSATVFLQLLIKIRGRRAIHLINSFGLGCAFREVVCGLAIYTCCKIYCAVLFLGIIHTLTLTTPSAFNNRRRQKLRAASSINTGGQRGARKGVARFPSHPKAYTKKAKSLSNLDAR